MVPNSVNRRDIGNDLISEGVLAEPGDDALRTEGTDTSEALPLI